MAADMTELIDEPIVAEETSPTESTPLVHPKRPLLDAHRVADRAPAVLLARRSVDQRTDRSHTSPR